MMIMAITAASALLASSFLALLAESTVGLIHAARALPLILPPTATTSLLPSICEEDVTNR